MARSVQYSPSSFVMNGFTALKELKCFYLIVSNRLNSADMESGLSMWLNEAVISYQRTRSVGRGMEHTNQLRLANLLVNLKYLQQDQKLKK